MARLLTIAALLASAHGLVGTKVPDVDIDFGFPPTKINLPSYVAGKKMILVSTIPITNGSALHGPSTGARCVALPPSLHSQMSEVCHPNSF